MTQSDFHRTNLNLFRTDVDWLVCTYGYGWTEKVRDIVHEHIKAKLAQVSSPPNRSRP